MTDVEVEDCKTGFRLPPPPPKNLRRKNKNEFLGGGDMAFDYGKKQRLTTDASGASKNQAKQVNANANTIAQNAIAKAMKSSKAEVAGEVAFA